MAEMVSVRVKMFDRLEVTPREAAAMRHQGLLAEDAPAVPALVPPPAGPSSTEPAPVQDSPVPDTSSTPSTIQEGPP